MSKEESTLGLKKFNQLDYILDVYSNYGSKYGQTLKMSDADHMDYDIKKLIKDGILKVVEDASDVLVTPTEKYKRVHLTFK